MHRWGRQSKHCRAVEAYLKRVHGLAWPRAAASSFKKARSVQTNATAQCPALEVWEFQVFWHLVELIDHFVVTTDLPKVVVGMFQLNGGQEVQANGGHGQAAA